MEAITIKPQSIIRYPRLDTVLMVEEFIQKHDGEFTRKNLWQKLPRKTMYQTFQVILTYLYESKKISIDSEGKIGWIPESTRKIDSKLIWRG